MSQAHLDSDVIEMLKDVMEDEFQSLIETFLLDGATRVEQMRVSLEANDGPELRKAAHSFKGSAGNLGAVQLAALLLHVETAAYENQLANLASIIDQCEQEFSVVKLQLSEV